MKYLAGVWLLAGVHVVVCAPKGAPGALEAPGNPLGGVQPSSVTSPTPSPSALPAHAIFSQYLKWLVESADQLLNPLKPYKIVQLQPQLRSEAKREVQVWGPYRVLPSENASTNDNTASGPIVTHMDPEGQSIWNGLTGFCSDCTVLYGSTYLSDVNGRRLEAKDGAYLHHSLVRPLSRLERPFWTCSEEGKPASKPMLSTSFFLAGSVETGDHWFTSTDGKSNSGYYLPKNSVYILQAEAINFKKTPQDWYVAAEIEYVPAKPSGLEVVTLAGISVSTCDSFSPTGSVYKPPKGAKQFNMTSPKFTMDRDLTLMRAVGHIHEGGVHNTLLLNDKLICKSDTVYGGSKVTFNREGGEKWESVSHMTPCEEPVQIKTGDVLRMTTYYDLDAHPIRQAHSHGQGSDEGEAMGMFSLFLAENEKDSRRFGS